MSRRLYRSSSPPACTVLLVLVACCLAGIRTARADGGCPDNSQDISTDRPSVTNSSTVVPTGSLQAENGINWTQHPGQGALDATNTRLRLGLGGCTEFLTDLPDYTGGITGHGPSGFSDIAPAVKHQFGGLREGTSLSATAGLAFPTGAQRISGSGYNPYLQFPWSQAIAEGLTAAGMLSTTWLTGAPQSETAIETTFLFDRQITEHSDAFAEYVGNYQTRGTPGQELNFGGSYRLTKTQQIDFHAGFGLNHGSPDYFVGIGYSIRFDSLW
jgi:hypothetical protein